MYLLTNHIEECTGCAACADRCPTGCISMRPDGNGFLLPVLNKEQCIRCKLCESVCPDFKIDEIGNPIRNCLYAINRNRAVTDNSTSGGVFYELAKKVIEDGGVVFGAAWTENYQLKHTMAVTTDELNSVMGSKYVQSDCTGVYSMVKQCLDDGKKVLFSGTPCQVAGLKKFIGQENKKLFLVDILCHGVPSQKLFDQWIREEEAGKGRIVSLKFRDKKKYGWQHCLTFETKNDGRCKRYDVLPSFNSYYHLFLTGYTLRDSCYQCKYAGKTRVGDITLGDYWGAAADKRISYAELKRGVSLVMCNTEKGIKAVSSLGNIKCQECDLENETRRNMPLRSAFRKPEKREEILMTDSVDGMYKKTVSAKNLLKERVKMVLPRRIYYFASGILSGRR